MVGRHVATENFFRAWLNQIQIDPVYCYSPSRDHYQQFSKQVADLAGPGRRTEWIPISETPRLAGAGALFRTDPRISELAWVRRQGNTHDFSILGIVHTLVEPGILDGIGQLPIAPLEPWDALICTSTTAAAFVRRLMGGYQDYLGSRFACKIPAAPLQLPVIPLGVDCAAFTPSADRKAAGMALRQRLGIQEDHVAVLFLGRISFLDKAHPMPMYLGLEQAARATGRKIHLLQVGQFSHKDMEPQFKQSAGAYCPTVVCHFLDSRDAATRSAAWAGADLFTSLADNIQETFGQTPVEAMAAGLPAVVSDWDGYRDTVLHGVTGFRAPVRLAPTGSGGELAQGHALGQLDYGRYIGAIGAATAVDVAACAEYYTALIGNDDLRQRMGQAALERARTHYDWQAVVRQYQELLSQLAAGRRTRTEEGVVSHPAGSNPLRPDPFWLYEDFATAPIRAEDCLSLADPMSTTLQDVLREPMNNMFAGLLLPVERLRLLLDGLVAGPVPIATLLSRFPPERGPFVMRSVAWLLKMGLVRIEPAAA